MGVIFQISLVQEFDFDLLMVIFLVLILCSLLAPFRAPESVTVHSSSSTRLKVKWSYLPEKDFQGQPLGYSLTYHPVDLEIELKFMSVNNMMNTTTLTNLAVYTMYVINVSAVSSGGVGPAKTGKGRTGAEGTKFLRQHWVRCVTPLVKGMQKKKSRMRTCVQITLCTHNQALKKMILNLSFAFEWPFTDFIFNDAKQ